MLSLLYYRLNTFGSCQMDINIFFFHSFFSFYFIFFFSYWSFFSHHVHLFVNKCPRVFHLWRVFKKNSVYLPISTVASGQPQTALIFIRITNIILLLKILIINYIFILFFVHQLIKYKPPHQNMHACKTTQHNKG